MYLASKNTSICRIYRQIATGLPSACNSPRSGLSSLHKDKPSGQQQHRRPPHTTTLSPPPAATAPSSTSPTSFSDEEEEGTEDNEDIFDPEDDDFILEKFAGMRKSSGGYTPFEFIEFSNIVLKHEVSIRVKAPPSHCYQVWHNRCNWMEWFDLIDEMGFHEEDRNLVSMYLWYRWALTPYLELYLTLGRSKDEENKYIVEEPVEGMPLVAAVLFQEDGGKTDNTDSSTSGSGSTIVTLRIGYQLPKVLYEFAGKLAVYADVDEKLRVAMKKMKGFAEGVDPAIVANMAQEAEAQITQGFIEQRGNEARNEERTRLKESEKKQAAAAAAAARAALAEADPTALEERKQSQQQSGGVGGALSLSSLDQDEDGDEDDEDTYIEEEDDNENNTAAAAVLVDDDEGKRLGRPKGTLNKHPKFPTSKDLTELRKRT